MMVRTYMSFSTELYKAIEIVAKKEKKTKSQVIRELLTTELKPRRSRAWYLPK